MLRRVAKESRGWARGTGLVAFVAGALCVVATAGTTAGAADTTSAETTALARAIEYIDHWGGDPKDLQSAKRELDAVLAINPGSAPAYREYARYYIADAYISGKDYDPAGLKKAEDALDHAIALSPDFAEAYVLRGSLYRTLDRPDDALAALRRAEVLGTNDPWLDLNWSDLLQDEGKHEEALSRCRGVLARKPANSKILGAADECLIHAYKALGRMDDADAAYRVQIARAPRDAWPRGNYASFLLCTRNQPDAAADFASQALQLMDYGMARGTLSAALYQSWSMQVLAGHEEAAKQAWTRAWSNAPADPAQAVANTCGRRASLSVLRAMRDTGRGETIDPLPAVLLAADSEQDGVAGIFAFEVAATGRKDGEIFLNSEADYRDQRNLTVRFTPEGAIAFRKQQGVDPDVAFKGKRIAVVGIARREKILFFANGMPTDKFYYQTHVVVSEPWQVVVERSPPPPPPHPGLHA
jgi:Tfp pilus assembly protein PilF